MDGLGAFYELDVHCRGEPDPHTGYLVNIAELDAAVRRAAIPAIQQATAARNASSLNVLRAVLDRLVGELGGMLASVVWRLTPYHAISMRTQAPHAAVMSQQFEFAASHRLHCPELSDEENRRLFGKCNHPSGHGHNYRLEVAVEVPLDAATPPLRLETLERIVNERVVSRFDHKHLNLDIAEFASMNPSVEQIARVCHELLDEPLAEAGGTLHHVTVWETEKTRCTYPALP